MSLLLSTLLAAALLPQDPAASPRPATPATGWNEPFQGLWIDPDLDAGGRHWCRGTRYKMAFGPQGATFVPLLGYRASRSYPIAFRLEGATDTPPRRMGTTFVYEHAGVVERWELAADGVEQSFLLASRPATGEVAIETSTELRFVGSTDEGLCFQGEGCGRVVYGHAVAIEPDGRSTPLATTYDGRRIHIALPAAARFPLLVDPVVAVVDVALQEVADNETPDVALHRGTGRWAVVMSERISALDTDIKLRRFDLAGNAVDTDFLEIGTNVSEDPAIACSQAGVTFMATWRQSGLDIMARGVTALGPLPSPTLTIFNGVLSLGTFGLRPDIGGSEGGGFLVSFTFEGTALPPSVRCRTLSDIGVLGPVQTVVGGTGCLSSAVSDRRPPADDWLVAYCRQSAGCLFGGDIGYAALDALGGFQVSATTIAGSVLDDDRNVDVAWNGSHGIVVWDRDAGSHRDLMARVVRKTGAGYSFVGAEHNLSGEEPGVNVGDDQYEPVIGSDGVRFVYCYREGNAGNLMAAGVGIAAAGLLFHEGHQQVVANGLDHVGKALAGGAPGPLNDTRWLIVADEKNGINDHDLRGVFYDGLTAGNMFAAVGTGCAPIGGSEPQIAATGSAAVGGSFTVTCSGTTALPFLIAGQRQTPVTLCHYLVVRRCQQGVSMPALAVVFGNSLAVTVPPEPGLVGLPLAFQGIDLLATGACNASLFGAAFAVSDTLIATVR